MFKTKTHAVDIVLPDPIFLPMLELTTEGRRNKQAVICLREFFAANPEAAQPGKYKVEMFRCLPSRTLMYDVYRFEQ